MLSLKARLGAVLGAAFLASALAMSAGMASAGAATAPAKAHVQVHGPMIQFSASGCNENFLNLVTECTAVSGSGLHINYLAGWAIHDSLDVQSYPQVHIELYGPHGHIKNCSVGDFPPGMQTATCKWSPNAKETAGNYCSRTWSLNGVTWIVLASQCIYVHA
jgi:hypothetical protein